MSVRVQGLVTHAHTQHTHMHTHTIQCIYLVTISYTLTTYIPSLPPTMHILNKKERDWLTILFTIESTGTSSRAFLVRVIHTGVGSPRQLLGWASSDVGVYHYLLLLTAVVGQARILSNTIWGPGEMVRGNRWTLWISWWGQPHKTWAIL